MSEDIKVTQRESKPIEIEVMVPIPVEEYCELKRRCKDAEFLRDAYEVILKDLISWGYACGSNKGTFVVGAILKVFPELESKDPYE